MQVGRASDDTDDVDVHDRPRRLGDVAFQRLFDLIRPERVEPQRRAHAELPYLRRLLVDDNLVNPIG